MTRLGRDGFTLIELVVVAFLISLFAAFAAPRIADLAGVELGASARRLGQMVRYLYEESALRGTIYGMTLDLDRQRISVVKLDPETGEFAEDEELLSRATELPDNVRLVAVVLPSVGRLQEGVAPIYFYPEGFADPAWIQLADTRNRVVTVVVDPIRGRTEIADGAVGP
ncbi:MAG: pilus assembly FimT family protein [Candidatus Binatia bacterium]